MKKLLLAAVCLFALGGGFLNTAFADGYDLTHKAQSELPTFSGSAASSDTVPIYDASAGVYKNLDATDIVTLDTTDTLTLSSALILSTTLDIDIDGAVAGTIFYHSANDLIYFCSGTGSCGQIDGI